MFLFLILFFTATYFVKSISNYTLACLHHSIMCFIINIIYNVPIAQHIKSIRSGALGQIFLHTHHIHKKAKSVEELNESEILSILYIFRTFKTVRIYYARPNSRLATDADYRYISMSI